MMATMQGKWMAMQRHRPSAGSRLSWAHLWQRIWRQIWLPCLCVLMGACLPGTVMAQTADPAVALVQPVPPLSGHVIDQTGTLSTEQRQALEAKLSAFEKARGTQMVVLLVPSTAPEDIAAFAQRVGDTWKIGRKGVGDGLLLIVAKNDRRVRIEVAKALEGAIPDLAASRIIEQAITPAFKAGDFAGGLDQGVDQLMARITGENLPLPEPGSGASRGEGGFNLHDLLVFGLIGVPFVFGLLSSIFGRKGGAALTGMIGGGVAWFITSSILIAFGAGMAAIFLALAFGNGGRGGWGGPPMGGGLGGGWRGGGGGWSSGGGGDFGGGGASGRW